MDRTGDTDGLEGGSPDGRRVADLLAVRLGLPLPLADEVVRGALSGAPLQVVATTPGVGVAAEAGLLVRDDDGELRATPWCAAFCRGGRGLSPAVHALTVPVPVVGGVQAEHVYTLLSEHSVVVEVLAPRTSVAPAYAASAMVRLGLQPLLLDLSEHGAAELGRLLPHVQTQAKLLGMGLVLVLDSAVAGARDVVGRLQGAGWPTVYVVERRTRTHTPREPFATVQLAADAPTARRTAWTGLLSLGDEEPLGLDELAVLPLSIPDMHEAYVRAVSEAAGATGEPEAGLLARHGRAVLMEGLSRLADLRQPQVLLSELVFDDDLAAGLVELTEAARGLVQRGAGDGKGLRALFTGPSGTGKTAAAAALGGALGLPVLFVDVSRVVDKYIGETEKNLDFLLGEAERAGAVLVFDEGESLFGARTGGSGGSSATQAANRQTAYLLARLEQHTGIVVLASNYPGLIDAAFTRRFHYAFTFRLPEQAERERLWAVLLRRFEVRTAVDVGVASTYELAGGNIANVCYLASLLEPTFAGSADALLAHLLRREYARLGKLSLSPALPERPLA